MKAIGFDRAEFLGKTGVVTSKFTEGALFRAFKAELSGPPEADPLQ